MAAAANDATALNQMQPGPHHFAGLRVKPWRHRAHSTIDWAIGTASQCAQLCNGPGLLCNEQEAMQGQQAAAFVFGECFHKWRELTVWVPGHERAPAICNK